MFLSRLCVRTGLCALLAHLCAYYLALTAVLVLAVHQAVIAAATA